MAFQLEIEKSLDGIANYFIRFGLCFKNQSIKFMVSLPGIEKKMNLNINIPTKEKIGNLDMFIYFIINFKKSQKWFLTAIDE